MMRAFVFSLLVLGYLVSSQPTCGAQIHADSVALAGKAFESKKIYLSNPEHAISLAADVVAGGKAINNIYLSGYGNYLLSKAYWAKGNYQLSTQYGFTALSLLEETSYRQLWGESLLALARTFIDLKNFEQANNFLARARALASSNDLNKLLADTHRELSMYYLERRMYDSSLFFADQGIAYYKRVDDTLNLSVLYGRKAGAYGALNDYNTSVAFNKQAVLLDSLIGNKRALGISYYQGALNEFKVGNLDNSIQLLQKSIRLVHENGSFKTLIKAHALLGEIHKRQNRPALAYQELLFASQYKDSLYSAERSGQIQEMQSLYDLNKKEAAIAGLEAEQTNQRTLAVVLTAGIILSLLLIFVLWRLRLAQKKTHEALFFRNQTVEHQREAMQAQAENLQQLNDLKSKLFSVISHDLRGPIGNLQALLDMVTRRMMTPDEFIAISHKLKSNLNLTQRTLENLLSWSLSQMEGMRTERAKFDIKQVIDDACRLLEEVAQRKSVRLECLADNSIPVLADHNQVQLIVRNLLHNAIKFSREDGAVEISAEVYDDYCRVCIRDNGVGMTLAETTMILDRREPFSKAGTHQEKGTGLGLLLCQEFVKRNGGSLSIHSTPGSGTEVSFTIPLAVAEVYHPVQS